MMNIESILSKRNFEHWPSYDLVYEWEDILEKELRCPVVNESSIVWNKYIHRIPYLPRLFQTNMNAFTFEMSPICRNRANNKTNIIPCIIDYYLSDKKLSDFVAAYNKNKIVFISSKEVYDYLLQKGVGAKLNLSHLPLSISDIYKIATNSMLSEKKYDLVLMGRQNPILKEFLDIYKEKHKDLYYVYREQKGQQFIYYTSQGECLGNINTRKGYINLMRLAKCGLYATPGIDGGKKRTNGFSQVTPRFLELIACGCHVIARYKENSDTDFFELSRFSESIDDYISFEYSLDCARNNSVDLNEYSAYLSNHYTSNRANYLLQALKNL